MDLCNDRFRTEVLIGEGGTARVYRGADLSTGHPVAVKVLHDVLRTDAECVARFETEAELLSRLEHPNLMEVLGTGRTTGDLPWFATPFARRGSLADQLVREGLMAAPDVLRYASDVLDCLHYLHELGVVHRDIKPENILIGDDDVALLCDLGIALTPTRRATMSGDRMGTPSFMPPEQYDDPSSVDATADLFGLGVTMFLCLTGQTGMVLLVEHLRGKALGALPPTVRGIVDRATRTRPEQRYPTAWAMALDVGDALDAE